VQPAEADVGALAPIVIGVAVSAVGRGDVRLDDNKVRLVREVELFDVLVLKFDFVFLVEVARQRRQSEWREQ